MPVFFVEPRDVTAVAPFHARPRAEPAIALASEGKCFISKILALFIRVYCKIRVKRRHSGDTVNKQSKFRSCFIWYNYVHMSKHSMSTQANRVFGLPHTFRALENRNFRLFCAGQSISLVGTWMQQVAMGWLVYRLTNSALILGVVGFVGQLPMFVLTPFSGVVADRYDRRRILIITQIAAMLQAGVLSVLVLTNRVAVWHIVILGLCLGIINAFDMPTRQAFTIDMIDRKQDLGNAIALNSSMVNVARLIGPTVAGIIIAAAGEGMCFLVNAMSYSGVIISLFALDIRSIKRRPATNNVFQDIKEGFVYAFSFAPIKTVLMLLGLVSLMGVSYQVLMPMFARDIFHGGPKTLGFLMGMSGVGALGGAIYLAGRKEVVGLGRMIPGAAFLFGLGLVIFSFSRVVWFAMAVMCVSGFAMIIQMAASNTLLQTMVEEDKRGRIMSLYTMAFIGVTPFGSLLSGSLAHALGAPRTIAISGMCCIIGALLFVRKLPRLQENLRRVHTKTDVIADVMNV